MNQPSNDTRPSDPIAERVQNLEELYMHLQRSVQDLDQVVLQQGKALAALEQQMQTAAAAVRSLSSAQPNPPLNLLDEKPPHY